MKFTVIDKQTGKYPNLQAIALNEDWANNLTYCDMSGFLVGEDGNLYLADDCGNMACCPQDRFEVVQWISVKDRLPEPNTWVLVYSKQGSYMNLKVDYITRDGSWFNSLLVTHWMPLPQKPESEDDNNGG